MKTTLVIGLLATALVGLTPSASAADCSTLDPGTPGPGAVGAAEWYALQNAFLACTMANSIQASALQGEGSIATKLGTVVAGAGALVNTAGLVPAATAFETGAQEATNSERHDGCGALIGDTNPQCGSDPAVSQAQACAGGAAIPNPAGGGLVGNTLLNANGALQATCALANAVVASVPTPGQVTDYEAATQATLLSLNGDVFDLGSSTLDAVCAFALGTVPCV